MTNNPEMKKERSIPHNFPIFEMALRYGTTQCTKIKHSYRSEMTFDSIRILKTMRKTKKVGGTANIFLFFCDGR